MKNKLLKADYKKLRISLFLVSLLSCLFITTSYSQTSTTTVTVNGNTTTTTTITNTPISTIDTPNTPNIGDITTTITNQTTTDTLTQIANTNSGNLVPTNFCDNSWVGTQKTNNPSSLTSDLGCNYITGKGTTYLENSKDLTLAGITQQEQNLGFTQSASAYVHHFWNWDSWLDFSQSVTNNDTGETITQNRIYSGNNSIPAGVKSLDNIIIGENSASGYTSGMRFDLASSGGGATWQGVDITNPNLSITYNQLTSTYLSELTTTTSIISCESLGTCFVAPTIESIELISEEEIKQIFKEEFAKVGLTEADIGMSDLDYKEMTNEINTQAVADMKEANPTLFTSDDNSTTKESSNASSQTTETTSTTTEKTETSTTKSTTSENTQTEGSSSKTSSSENVSNEEGSTTETGTTNASNATSKDEKISVSVKAAVEKVERELKSIGDKTKAIQEIKIDGIKAGAPNLGTYENRSFYEPKYYNGVPNPDFYLQADIAQKPVYANVTLAAYTNNDPIGKQQAAMQEIQDEMNDIIIQLEQLKRK
jgi:hypothetical protein